MWQPQHQPSGFINRWRTLATVGANSLLIFPLIVGGVLNTLTPVSAQIVPDNTLPTNSIVPAGCTICTIDGGTIRNGNWFHSFSQFSVPSGGQAFFNNVDPAIQNIFARVTGGSVSQINGTLRANGNANLFLINPSGIIFGSNAQLNIGGSFIASTADSLRFSDGSEFSAMNPSASPLLTVSVPLGLQYGSNPGRIEVQGSGNQMFVNPSPFEIVRDFRPSGLQVRSGQTLALVGGEVRLQGGNLTAAEGRVELGSVAGGMVTLTPTNPGWTLGYQNVQTFGDIRLSQAASVDASGNSGGVIQVQSRNISLTDGSALLTLTAGSGQGGQLNINATGSVEVSGSSIDPVLGPLFNTFFPSALLTEVNVGATGQGGDLNITTGRILVADGAKVSVSTSGPGTGGNMQIQAQTIELARSSPFFGPSQFAADASNPDSGQGGNITLNASQVLVNNGGWMTAGTGGTGSAGTIRINAPSIELGGGSDDPIPASIATQVGPGSRGNGGNIRLDTNRLQVSNGAQIATSTFGIGNAGLLQIFAQDVEVVGGTDQSPSGLFSTVNPGASGQGGNLEITTTEWFRVADGAQVAVDTLGSGNAGALIVKAQTIELSGFNQQGKSGLFAGAIIGSGSGGDLNITADQLTIRDGATISVSNFSSRNPNIPPGQGPAGNTQIAAKFLQLDNGATLTAASAGGDKGNITLNSETIVLRRGSSISTNALGNATGGNININTNFLVAVPDENSDVTANATNNFGGRVIVNATNILGIEYRDQLTPLSDITASSALGASFNGIVEINTPGVDPSRGITEFPTGVVDPSSQIATSCGRGGENELTISGRGGLPEDASQPLRGQAIWQDFRLAESQSGESIGKQGQIDISTTWSSPSSVTPIVEARGWVTDAQGRVTLVAQVSQTSEEMGRVGSVVCKN